MATSGSWDYSLTAANIVDMAVENLGILHSGGTIVAADQTLALRRLNVIAKQFQGVADKAQGLKIHTRQRITLVLAKGQQSYLIGPASTDARASTQVGRTTIDVAEAAGQTVISVAATSDTTSYPGTTLTMTASDIIGIEQTSGVIFWSTVSSISAGDTVTIASGLDSAAAVGRHVYWFTSRAQRFPHLEAAVLRTDAFQDTPLIVYRDVQSYELGVVDKNQDEDPTSILVEPLRIATRVTFDTQPDDMGKTVVITALYPAEDYDATTDDIAFPQEWLRPLAWEVSFEIAPAFGAQWTPAMEQLRQESLQTARQLNPDTADLYFQPGRE